METIYYLLLALLSLLLQFDFLAGRPVQLVHFSPEQQTTLLVVHGSVAAEDPTIPTNSTKNFITLWNVCQPDRPLSVLSANGSISCACFQLDKSALIFAGCADGSVVVWDLR